MRFDVGLGKHDPGARRTEDEPMRILIVGDLTGARAGDARPLAQRPIVRIDPETFDDVFARLEPAVALPALGLEEPLAFASLDDFHPDELFRNVPIFDRLRTIRHRLQDPSTFAAAADELRADIPTEPSREPEDSAPPPAEPAPPTKADPFLEQLLGKGAEPAGTPSRPAAAAAPAGVEGFIRSLVAPHIVAGTDPQLPQFLSAVDAAITDSMRALLHDAAFQRLEAVWRGVHGLLSAIEEEGVEVSLLQSTPEELRVEAGPEGALGGRLAPRGADTPPWSVVVVDAAFGPTAEDVGALRDLASTAARAGTRVLAAAEGGLVGCTDFGAQSDPKTWTALPEEVAPLWTALRAAPDGRALGLVWPRLLLRLPYGATADPIDAFGFEEIPASHDHEAYLWGNGAFAAARVMLQAFLGTPADPEGEIGDLPAYTYTEDGESTLKPCAEFCMTRQAAAELLDRGFIPLASYQNRNAVRLLRLQSIAAAAID